MIQILIPTFNRAHFLKKNLKLLTKQINDANLEEKITISIADNCSEDETLSIVKQVKNNSNVNINLYVQKENIGLEKNATFLLEKSTDNFIMYLGDDDFLPENYLQYLIDKIDNIENLTCVIPGFSALYPDGTIKLARSANFDEKRFDASFQTVLKISHFGHQLSGVLLKREGLYNNYNANKKLRNIYPFIFFVAYNNLRGASIYAPKYQVLVSQKNSKDWNYDDSGLLTEIFKNYRILFNDNYLKRNISNICFMKEQYWRLQISKNLINSVKGFKHLATARDIELLTKIALPFLYLYGYAAALLLKIKNI